MDAKLPEQLNDSRHEALPARRNSGLVCRWLAVVSILIPSPIDAGSWSEPVKLSSNINGPSDERFPFVTADNQRLYWCSSNRPEGHGTNEDIYVAIWDSTQKDWGPRQVLGEEINTFQRELSPCESPDRQYLWFTRWNPGMGYDLYYSVWDTANAKWGTAVNAGPQFNSPCVEWSVSISPDGKRMFLVHGIRPGTVMCEGEVLWISYWNDSTQWWDSLLWMGNTLNAGAIQYSASMAIDTTFFVAATGSNLGDLFRVSHNPPYWDTIVNLGSPPNSSTREETVALSPDGKFLYFTSWRDTSGTRPDIYVSERLVSTGISRESVVPADFVLHAAHPNPFNAQTECVLTLQRACKIRLTVHNCLGQLIAQLGDEVLDAGTHTFAWRPLDAPSGVYFLRATDRKGGQVQKMLLLK